MHFAGLSFKNVSEFVFVLMVFSVTAPNRPTVSLRLEDKCESSVSLQSVEETHFRSVEDLLNWACLSGWPTRNFGWN
jgi:hypothetical protein